MAAPGSSNNLGIGNIDANSDVAFEVPVNRFCGSRHDMGSLALFLVANWFVNGETVLIDGGVSTVKTCTLGCAPEQRADLLACPCMIIRLC